MFKKTMGLFLSFFLNLTMVLACQPDQDFSQDQKNSKGGMTLYNDLNASGNFMNLSPEMHYKVVDHLTSKDLGRIAQVSHYWYEIYKNSSRHSVIVIGNTGSGVSTFAHLLAGESLTSFKSRFGWFSLMAEDKLLNDNISHRLGESYTKEPSIILDSNRKRDIWDCPGFYHTAGAIKGFENAVAIHRLLMGKFKVIFLVENAAFSVMYGACALDYFSKVAEIFSDQNELHKCVYVVLSKVPNNCTGSGLIRALKDNYLSGRISGSQRAFMWMNYLLDNPKHLTTFEAPTEEGTYIPSKSLQELIENTEYMISPGIETPTNGISRHTGWLTRNNERSN